MFQLLVLLAVLAGLCLYIFCRKPEPGDLDNQGRYEYTALDAKGREFTATVEADSQDDAVEKIREMDYFPLTVRKVP